MSLQETVHELNETFKKENTKLLQDKINELEKIIVNLTERVDYLERRCQ